MFKKARVCWTSALLLTASLATTGCDDEKLAGLGEPCDLRSGEVGVNTVAVEQGNPDCKSGMCMSFLGNEFCTDQCVADADCPETMVCMDMEPVGGTGSWCVLIGEGTDLEPSYPIPGSARYHADDALVVVQAEWAADAYLVAVYSHDVGISGLLETEGSSWSYTFLAASNPDFKAEIEITADGAGEIWQTEYDPDFGPIDVDLLSGTLWRFDSHDLYALASPHGAAEFVSDNPDPDTSYNLNGAIVFSDDMVIWGVNYTGEDFSDFWIGVFNAETGAMIDIF